MLVGLSISALAQDAATPTDATTLETITVTANAENPYTVQETSGALKTDAPLLTTPQAVSLFDVRKGIGMFRDLRVPVLGIVENMSYYVCPHGERVTLFGEGGGQRLAAEFGVPLLAQLPLHPEIRAGADAGEPVLVRRPDSPEGDAFRALAGAVAARVSTIARLKMPRIS